MIGLWNKNVLVMELEYCHEARDRSLAWLTARLQRASGRFDLLFPADWLPPTGLAAYRKECSRDVLSACAFLYLEQNSPVAVCGWVAANPQNTARQSYDAVSALLKHMPDYAKVHGKKHLLTTFGNRGINRILDQNGFITGDQNVQHQYLLLT